MRLKKKEALVKAQENVERRKKLMDGATERYNKAIERLRKAELALSGPTETFSGTSMSTGTWNVDFAKEPLTLSREESKEMGY